VPRLLVDIRERDFAVAGVDAVDARLPLRIEIALLYRTIWELDLVGLAGNGLARLIEEFDLDPVTGLGRSRTCRVG